MEMIYDALRYAARQCDLNGVKRYAAVLAVMPPINPPVGLKVRPWPDPKAKPLTVAKYMPWRLLAPTMAGQSGAFRLTVK
jgi:hypothetical protein